MGIKSFSKFVSPKEVKLKKMQGKVLAVDASVIMYQAALGAKSIKTLTDSNGNSTMHISVIMAKILNFKKNNIKQIWVFDYHEKGYTQPNKSVELERRKKRRDAAKARLTALNKKKTIEEELFSSDDDENAIAEEKLDDRICAQEKQCFSMNDRIVNDVKFILDCFGVSWIISKKNIEAEHTCAALTMSGDVDAVFSTDVDALMYGAKELIRSVKIKSKRIFQSYILSDVLADKKITLGELRKIGVILGCDHAKKTPRVGPKTVLKKYKDIELTNEQKKAVKIFEVKINVNFDNKKLNNEKSNIESVEHQKINTLLSWLVSKNFNKSRVKKQIQKVYKSLV